MLGHTVIVPRRYAANLFEATEAEQNALLKALAQAKNLVEKHYQPAGYNIGINKAKPAVRSCHTCIVI